MPFSFGTKLPTLDLRRQSISPKGESAGAPDQAQQTAERCSGAAMSTSRHHHLDVRRTSVEWHVAPASAGAVIGIVPRGGSSPRPVSGGEGSRCPEAVHPLSTLASRTNSHRRSQERPFVGQSRRGHVVTYRVPGSCVGKREGGLQRSIRIALLLRFRVCAQTMSPVSCCLR